MIDSKRELEIRAEEEWVTNFVTPVIEEIFTLIDEEERLAGRANWGKLQSEFISGYVGSTIYSMIRNDLDKCTTNDEAFMQSSKNFLKAKELVSKAVGRAFELAMKEFSGREVKYHVSVDCVTRLESEKVN